MYAKRICLTYAATGQVSDMVKECRQPPFDGKAVHAPILDCEKRLFLPGYFPRRQADPVAVGAAVDDGETGYFRPCHNFRFLMVQ